ncbi:4553_t:CDS:2, partial [Gigaspora margarita]
INDEPQITLKSLLNSVEVSNIIKLWRIHCIGGLSHRENIVILLSDGTHLCTCMEMVIKGIICCHFWRVMLYSRYAKFYISIILARWYKNNIVDQLDAYLDNLPVLTAIKPCTKTLPLPSEAKFTLQSLNRFGIAFSVSKTAINIALETNNSTRSDSNNLCKNSTKNVSDEVVPLQQQLIGQITEPKVVKIHGAPSKKRMKSFTEEMGKK